MNDREQLVLRPYQERMEDHVIDHYHCALWADMGAGKTATLLSAIVKLLAMVDISKVLVVAPKRVAAHTWPAEVKRWAQFAGLTVRAITAEDFKFERREVTIKRKRETTTVKRLVPTIAPGALLTGEVIHTISRDLLPQLVSLLKLSRWPYDMIVLDDCGLRDLTTAKCRAIKALRKHTPARMVQLSGTPRPKSLVDIWPQLYLIDQGERLGRTQKAFLDCWFVPDQRSRDRVFSHRPRNDVAEAEIFAAVGDVCVSLLPEDVVQLPALSMNVVTLAMDNRARELYLRLAARHLITLNCADVTASNAAVLVGKLLQLACLAEGTEVLTERGWVAIEHVTETDRVWDGIAWASCCGSTCTGYKDVIECDGVFMTPEHKVLTVSGWATAQEIIDGDDVERLDREGVRLPDGFEEGRNEQEQECHLVGAMCLRKSGSADRVEPEEPKPTESEVMRVQAERNSDEVSRNARADEKQTLRKVGRAEAEVPESEKQGLCELRRPGDNYVPKVDKIIRGVFGGYGADLQARYEFGSEEQRNRVLERELSMGHTNRAREQREGECFGTDTNRRNDSGGSRQGIQAESDNNKEKDGERGHRRPSISAGTKARVYDVVNVFPRTRFTVRGRAGKVFIAHNSGAVYDEDGQVHEVHTAKLDYLDEVIEAQPGVPLLVGYWFQHERDRIKARYPHAVELEDYPDTEDRWNRGEIDLLLLHPQGGAHGLNLQFGDGQGFWFGPIHNLELWQQWNKRLHRPGRKTPVVIHVPVMAGTIEGEVLESLNPKAAGQQRLLEAVRLEVDKVRRGV